jgi:hypothetical protein
VQAKPGITIPHMGKNHAGRPLPNAVPPEPAEDGKVKKAGKGWEP